MYKGVAELPDFSKVSFPPFEPIDLTMLMMDTHDDDIEYAKFVLKMDPCTRPTAKDALSSQYFIKTPFASSCADIALHYELSNESLVESSGDIESSVSKMKKKVKPIGSVDEFVSQFII